MADKPATNTLVDEKLALSLFLDSLLTEPAVEFEAPTEVVPEVANPAPLADQPEPVVEANIEQKVAVATAEAPVVEGGLPEWADEFQAMLFNVAGLTLAVPLEELNGVVEFEDNLTQMPGHADFYMGILQYLDKKVPVVDTARLVFPPNKLSQLAGDEPAKRVRRIVLINEGRWGLACDDVDEVITLRKHEVRWRSSRTKRKWLLGTVIQHMCALIDTHAFAEKLVEGSE